MHEFRTETLGWIDSYRQSQASAWLLLFLCYNGSMNYELEISQSNPALFDSLNGTVPPLVAGSGSASLLSARTTSTFWGFVAGKENIPFTLEVWYLPVTFIGTGEVVVIGHADEGLIYNGSQFILRVRLTDEILEQTWTPQEIKASHYAIVYDGSGFTLYVDGTDVVSLEIPAFSTFASSDTNIGLNNPVNVTASGIYDSLALYYRALPAEEIGLHYTWGRDVMASNAISTAKGGSAYALSFDQVDTLQTITFDSNNWGDWGAADMLSTDPLQAPAEGAVWEGAIPIGSIMESTPGIYVSWVGDGATVEYSLDRDTWTPLVNRSTFLEDASTVDKTIYIRIGFADGEAWMEKLSFILLESRTLLPLNGVRQLTFKSASMDEIPGHQLEYHADGGATIRNGYIQVEPHAPSAEEAVTTVRTLEFWAKIDDTIGFLFRESASNYVRIDSPGNFVVGGVTAYRNGVALSGSVPAGWNHYVIVLPTAVNTQIRLGNNLALNNALSVNIAHLAVYPNSFAADQALSLYNQNIGAPAIQVIDSGSMEISESTPATDIYAYVWSTVTS